MKNMNVLNQGLNFFHTALLSPLQTGITEHKLHNKKSIQIKNFSCYDIQLHLYLVTKLGFWDKLGSDL